MSLKIYQGLFFEKSTLQTVLDECTVSSNEKWPGMQKNDFFFYINW